jgi:hypothetical protein
VSNDLAFPLAVFPGDVVLENAPLGVDNVISILNANFLLAGCAKISTKKTDFYIF